ncbi:MAG: DUF3536 domain-containing protein [Candidatus Eisenbacteria bacterium]|nr:DUF3536 domain-containing protein [Candidatus Eisenbacteria bacterium]
MERFLCVHGHFYQPPRENPWLEAVEIQNSAAPYHDWNDRITEECYIPNTMARILDDEERLVTIVNNYSRISFNFGPTLLSWMERRRPELAPRLREADDVSRRVYSGHGNAIAQAYNHIILPLANTRDKRTQVIWGRRDFESRFGREPEGMWLPETAVDLESLDIMAEFGMRFAILAPHQARRVRPLDSDAWTEVNGQKIDPTRAYLVKLPSGRTMSLFFYDGPIAKAIAFEGLLSSGENFARRLQDGFSDQRRHAQLVHIATDGESYGHHHRFGEMALAYALQKITSRGQIRLTNYGEYLEKFPPEYEVEIQEDTSWSCSHGIERWRSNCGCEVGSRAGWNQAWRTPLRESLDWLRDTVAPAFEDKGREIFKDPWAARDSYIEVLLKQQRVKPEAFIAEQAARPLQQSEIVKALRMMELQRHAMLMYTSCGWFFADPSGIETIQIIQYAGRVIQLAREALGLDLEEEFLKRFSSVSSNDPLEGNGRALYMKHVVPAVVDLEQVGAHAAIAHLFGEDDEENRIYCYTTARKSLKSTEAGRARLDLGAMEVTSNVTLESAGLNFAVFHLGDQNLNAGVRRFDDEEKWSTASGELSSAFSSADYPQVMRLVDRYFESRTYSIKSLFLEEQRRILDKILQASLLEADASYRQIYERNAPLMRMLANLGLPGPRRLQAAAGIALDQLVHETLASDEPDADRFQSLWDEAGAAGVELDKDEMALTLRDSLKRLAHELRSKPLDTRQLARLEAGTRLLDKLPVHVDTVYPQIVCYEIFGSHYTQIAETAESGNAWARQWTETFRLLAQRLKVRID